MILLFVSFPEENVMEAAVRLDDENVLIIDLYQTRAGYNASVQFGLYDYGGNVPSYAFDHARVSFGEGRTGEIERGEFKTFLTKRPTKLEIGDKTYNLEYLDDKPETR